MLAETVSRGRRRPCQVVAQAVDGESAAPPRKVLAVGVKLPPSAGTSMEISLSALIAVDF